MTEKRFQDIGGYITDTDSYCCTKVYEKTSDIIDLLNELHDENEQLKNEINMLRTTIARNESYLKRITEISEWSN